MKLYGKVYFKKPFINDNLEIDYKLTETEEVEFINSNLNKENLTEKDDVIVYDGKIISVIPNMYNFNENERIFITSEPLIVKEEDVSEDLKEQLKIALKIREIDKNINTYNLKYLSELIIKNGKVHPVYLNTIMDNSLDSIFNFDILIRNKEGIFITPKSTESSLLTKLFKKYYISNIELNVYKLIEILESLVNTGVFKESMWESEIKAIKKIFKNSKNIKVKRRFMSCEVTITVNGNLE